MILLDEEELERPKHSTLEFANAAPLGANIKVVGVLDLAAGGRQISRATIPGPKQADSRLVEDGLA